MSDNIKDVYNVVSKSNLFVDENDFRNQIASNPKEVFEFISKDKNTQGLFVDFNDFQNNIKKKDQIGSIPSKDFGQISSPIGFSLKSTLPQQLKGDGSSTSTSPNFGRDNFIANRGFLQKNVAGGAAERKSKQEDNQQGWLLNTVSALDKGFLKNLIGSPVKGLGLLIEGATKKVVGGTGKAQVSDALIKFGDYFNNAIDELAPQDQEFKDTLWDQAAQALGQVASLIATGGITGAAGKTGQAAEIAEMAAQVAPKGTAAATALKTLGSELSAPTAVSAGLSMGQAEFDRAIQAGATDDQAFEAFYKNAAVGSVLETIPVMQFFKRFNNATAGGVANYIKTKGVAGITGGIEEMTTEVLQQLYSNKTAKDIYNINQDILDGVGSSGGVGFGVGFLLNALGANAKILRKQGREQEANTVENQINQFEDNLKNPKITSGNKVTAKKIVTQGIETGAQKAVVDLDRDLANNVITPEQHQEGIIFAEKAAQVSDKIPETVTGESRVKSIELLVERNDIKQANQNLLQQKQNTDEAYHAGIDEEIKANEERIKKIDADVYNIAKNPSKDFGDKKYIVDGEEVSQEAYEALKNKPVGTKTIIKTEKIEQPTQEQIQDDVKNKRYASFTYKSEAEVPDVFKDKIVTRGENTLQDGTVEKFVRVTVPQSVADYELSKTQEVAPTKEVKSTEVKNVEQRKEELQRELNDLDLKPLPFNTITNKDGTFSYENMSDAEYKVLLDKREAKKAEIIAELKTLKEVKPTEAKKQPKQKIEKAPITMKGVKALDTKELNKKAAKIEASDARSAVLKYLSGGNLSRDAIDELFGRKKGGLNTGERELKSEEAKTRDYIAKLGEGDNLDDAAHAIWEALPESVKEGKSEAADTQAIKDELEKAISEYKTKSEATKALVEGYTEESLDDLESKYYEKYGDNAEIEIDKELNQVPKNQLDIEQELINANYESEEQFQNDYWNAKETTNDFTEKTPSTETEEAETAKGLEEAYKDLTINQKRQIINSKFDELLQELKIEKICPT